MPKSIKIFVIFLLIAIDVGCSEKSATICESCTEAKRHHQWCEACGVGYVAGVAIPSRLLFETLDAHGHDLDLRSIFCPTCRSAIESDGFCAACKIGWFNKQAYFSRLTYWLAQGESRDKAGLTCERCRKLTGQAEWCDSCGVGSVGNVAFRDRAAYEAARPEYERLRAAVKTLDRCEYCAVALWTDTTCFDCKITYQDGKPVP
ncbi:MAG: hypothetical protein ACE5EQ_03225 [Phycisphaerae bacterium]